MAMDKKVKLKKHIASLKLTVLNPKGRIWTLVACGGASDLGFSAELCNYGEYSCALLKI